MKKHFDTGFPRELQSEFDARQLEESWKLLGDAAPHPVLPEETDRAWTALVDRIGLNEDSAPDSEAVAAPHGGASGLGRTLLRVAAVAVVALGATVGWYSIPVTRTAQVAEQRSLVLPDGTAVELNAGSTLSYRRGFSLLPGVAARTRAVHLEGEAFFDVQPGVRPFRVEAGPAEIRVLGTRFNVRARETDRDRAARVEVEEGRVEVWSLAGSSSLILTAGEAARVVPGGAPPAREPFPLARIGSWRSGGLTIVDEPLSAILTELSLRFDVRITLVDPGPGTNRLSVFYPEVESLESVLADLAIQQSLRYRRTSDGWELF